MKIIIKESNRERIDEAITKAEGRATKRLSDYDQLSGALELLIERLSVIPQADQRGIRAELGGGWAVPNSYRGIADETVCTVERVASGWALVDVHRGAVPNTSYGESREGASIRSIKAPLDAHVAMARASWKNISHPSLVYKEMTDNDRALWQAVRLLQTAYREPDGYRAMRPLQGFPSEGGAV